METLVNFRDIGGYQTPKGKVVTGKFFRSGEPVGLSTNDKDLLTNTYHIKHIYDFRKKSEVEEKPVDDIVGATYQHIDIMESDTVNASFTSMLKNHENADAVMQAIYKNIIVSKGSQEKYRQFLEAIYDCDQEAILFHCFAGKDRTGIGAALILKILGVSDEDIYYDFLLTNASRKSCNEAILQQIRESGESEETIAEIGTMLYVKKEYLESAFAMMEEMHGSFAGYVKNALQISDDFVLQMQERFVK